MASFLTGKMKRKAFEEVYEDFSDLTLSAPATKIRRLDAELLPIIEERCPIGGSVFESQLLKGDMDDAMPELAPVTEKAVLPPTVNEERALVLYKPLHSHFGSSLKMDPELINSLKNPSFRSGYQNIAEEEFFEEQQSSSTNSLAVIPWIPSHFSSPNLEIITSESGATEETMQAGADGESMEVDSYNEQLADVGVGPGSFTQWQQHCMIPDHMHLSSTPVLGSW